MKKKKLIIGIGVALLLIVTVGCGNNAKDKNSSAKVSQSSSEEAASSSETSESSIVYTAVVKTDSNSEAGQILVEKLTPISSEDETPAGLQNDLVLLTDGSNVFDATTKEPVVLADIKAGSTLQVTLAAQAVTTMSLPPQVPGRDVHEILVK